MLRKRNGLSVKIFLTPPIFLPDEDIEKHFQEANSRATYACKKSADEFIKYLSNYLNEKFKNCLLAASDFSLMAGETTDISDRAELAIFIRYVNSDSYQVTEQFPGLVEVNGCKGTKASFNLICNVLKPKETNIKQMRFNRMDGTNTMSGERSGLHRRFRHEVPHTKYINCRNHKLALVFVHLLPNFKALQNVDSGLLSSWKMMKYSTVKNAVFGEAQETFGKKKRKLLKAAAARWLSHGEASYCDIHVSLILWMPY